MVVSIAGVPDQLSTELGREPPTEAVVVTVICEHGALRTGRDNPSTKKRTAPGQHVVERRMDTAEPAKRVQVYRLSFGPLAPRGPDVPFDGGARRVPIAGIVHS